MYFKFVLIIFICRFNDILTRNIYPREEKPNHKLNVVLFFAKCSNKIPNECSALQFLEMHQIARVKHNIPAPHYNQLSMDNVIQRNTPNCKELLKDGLASLVHYCQNALGMKTAVASVSNQEITNDISNAEPDVPPEIRERQAYMREDANSPVRVRVVNLRDIITSPEHKEVFKIRVKRHQPNAASEKPVEIVDVPLGKENKKAPWDVLDVMAHIKFSFFGKMFENGAKNKIAQEENQLVGGIDQTKTDPGLFEIVKSTLASLQEIPDQGFLMVIFGGHLEEISNQQSPLIQSIKHVTESTEAGCTLLVLTCSCPGHEEQPNHENHGNHDNGLNHENYENHDNGFNHENHGNHDNNINHENHGNHDNGFNHEYQEHSNHQNVVNIKEDPKVEHEADENIPVFAKGPRSDLLSQCTELYDIPLTVKTIVGETSPSFGEKANVAPQRNKRALFSGIPLNRKEENHVGNIYDKFQPVIFYLCTSILFII